MKIFFGLFLLFGLGDALTYKQLMERRRLLREQGLTTTIDPDLETEKPLTWPDIEEMRRQFEEDMRKEEASIIKIVPDQ